MYIFQLYLKKNKALAFRLSPVDLDSRLKENFSFFFKMEKDLDLWKTTSWLPSSDQVEMLLIGHPYLTERISADWLLSPDPSCLLLIDMFSFQTKSILFDYKDWDNNVIN
jgi:hypothetical protein